MHKNKLNPAVVQNASSAKQIKIGNYILGATIGKGNSAVVKIATHSIIKHKAAIKIFDKSGLDSEKQQRLRREIDSMKRLKHQNIIRLYEIMETPKLICLVTEYANNGELYDFIMHKKRLSEREARHVFKQIVTAVHYCHVNHIVHRDIKVENILLDSNFRIKLADFGFSSVYKQGELLDVYCGSPQYCAPELYKAELYDGPKVDIWSLGVVLYVLVCGYLPFEAQVFAKLKSQIISGSYKKPFFLSEDCKSLIEGMLTLDSTKRFSITDIINHRWFQTDSDSVLFNFNSSTTSIGSNNSSTSDQSIYQEFRCLIDKIEQISIKEFKPDENVLFEIAKYGINIDDVVNSVRNNEFDSYAGIYYLVEAKLNDTTNLNNLKYINSNNNQISFNDAHDMTNSNHHNTNSTSDENNNNNKTSLNYTKCENDIKNRNFITTNAQESSNINTVKRSFNELITTTYNQAQIEYQTNFNSNHTKNDSQQITNHLTGFKTILESMRSSCSSSNKNDEDYEEEKNGEDEEDNDDDDDDDDEMPIEELGRNYLFRCSAIRRHTIGTNFDNNQSNSIVKSTECLHMLHRQENDEDVNKTEEIINSTNRISTVNKNNANDSFNTTNKSFMNVTTNHITSGLFNNNNNTVNNLSNNIPFSMNYNVYQLQNNNSNLINSYNLLQNQQEKNLFQEMNSIDCKYLHPFPNNSNNNNNTTLKEENKTKSLKQSNELGFKKYPHRQYHTNYSKFRNKHNRLVNGSEQQQQLQQQQTQLHNESSLTGRRASDGGSNISLFNQYYSLKNVYRNHQNNFNNELDSNSNQDYLNVNNLATTLYQSRGSITSGIPIFSASTQLAETSRPESPNNHLNNNNSSPTGCLSSEDDEMNMNLSNVIKHQRKSSRHEPYTESGSNMSKLCRPVSPFASRKREQSFSGSNSTGLHGFSDSFNRNHRVSEPNPLETIIKFGPHLERIYNQSINKANVSPNKELLMLQQENPSIDEKTQFELQVQHQNLIQNFPNNSDMSLLNGSYSSKSPLNNNMLNTDSVELSEITDLDQQQQQQGKTVGYLNSSSYTQSDVNSDTSAQNTTMLQIIQEEQSEMSMTLSSSSSLSSSPSITPRSIRSMITLNSKPQFDYPILVNGNSDDNPNSTSTKKNKQSILNQYIPNMNRLQNNQ